MKNKVAPPFKQAGVTLLDVPGLAFTRLPLLVDLRGTDLLALMRNAARTDGPGAALADLCERADAVVVDDDRSRDILLGALAGAHRVNDAVYDSDPSLSELIAVDPAGAAVLAKCLNRYVITCYYAFARVLVYYCA